LIEERNVDRRSTRNGENDGQENQSARQMASVVPRCRDVGEFGKCIYAQKNTTTATRPMIFSMSALGGAVACLIMIVATLAEFSYIPTTWNF
jgi:hypothetical protein